MARTKKEQMQMMILGAVAAGVALFVAVNFLLVPKIAKWKKDTKEVASIRKKVEERRATVRTRTNVLAQIAAEHAQLNTISANIPLPVLGNYILGMEQQLRDCAASTQLQISSVSLADAMVIPYAESLCQARRVRVAALGDINDLIDFFQQLESVNALINVAALDIIAQPNTPAQHQINFVLEWIVWTSPDNPPDYLIASQF